MNIKKHSAFQIFCAVVSIAALLLMGTLIFIIVSKGIAALSEHLKKDEIRFAVWLSMKSAFISTICCFLLAVPTAYTLTRSQFRKLKPIETMLEITMSLPNIVIGLSLLILFSSPLGKTLKTTGFPVVFSANGVIIAQMVVNFPFAAKLIISAFQDSDRKLELVSGLLGANYFQQFKTILLPLCKSSLISAFILIWSRALGEFGATLMLVGVTRMKTETLPASIYLAVSTSDLSAALASAFVLLIISAISLYFANSITKRDRKRYRYE